ncbi:MAG: hypothetical protein ACRDRU_18235 [Pseudonocardiaceae bacterium]
MDPEPAREEALAGSLLGQVPVVCVSGVTGAGLDELSAALVTGLPAPDVEANVRLWVDRAFTMHGAGTLASETATSWSWVPEAGGWVVRALQSLAWPVQSAPAVALNLRGASPSAEVMPSPLSTPTSLLYPSPTWRHIGV